MADGCRQLLVSSGAVSLGSRLVPRGPWVPVRGPDLAQSSGSEGPPSLAFLAPSADPSRLENLPCTARVWTGNQFTYSQPLTLLKEPKSGEKMQPSCGRSTAHSMWKPNGPCQPAGWGVRGWPCCYSHQPGNPFCGLLWCVARGKRNATGSEDDGLCPMCNGVDLAKGVDLANVSRHFQLCHPKGVWSSHLNCPHQGHQLP